MKQTRYIVHLPEKHLARFSDPIAALDYAREISLRGGFIEVSDRTGLIGQFENGEPTPEFAHLYTNKAA